jgi:hypothetical protein
MVNALEKQMSYLPSRQYVDYLKQTSQKKRQSSETRPGGCPT